MHFIDSHIQWHCGKYIIIECSFFGELLQEFMKLKCFSLKGPAERLRRHSICSLYNNSRSPIVLVFVFRSTLDNSLFINVAQN